jgi:phage-related protein (TIGR01555 family)
MAVARISKSTIDKAAKDERRAIRESSKSAKLTADAYQNFVQSVGLGTDNSMSGSTYGFAPITRIRTLLEWIYRGSWLGGVAVDIVADDMTREGIELVSTIPPEDVEKLQQTMTRLGVWGGINDTIKWSRLYGGCIGVLLIDGQDVSTPLNIDRVGKGAFKGILPLDRWMVEPNLNDLVTDLGPELGLPKYYRVVADAPALRMKNIHYSRCMRLIGIKLPYWQAVMENLWGLSVFERLYDRMVCFDSATLGMAQLASKAFIRTYKLKGFRKLLAEGGNGKNAVMAWVQLMRQLQGNEGITLIDGDDEFQATQGTSFVGIGEVILQLAQQIGGGLQTPLTRLLGQSPAGLNATGESDLRTYYDGTKQKQEMELREPLTKILRVTAKSEGVALPDNFYFTFMPLWQLSEDQKSQIFARDSAAIADLLSEGIISMQVALKELRQLSRSTGRMSNIADEDIDAADDKPAPGMEMPPGIEPKIGPDKAPEDKKIKSAEDSAHVLRPLKAA